MIALPMSRSAALAVSLAVGAVICAACGDAAAPVDAVAMDRDVRAFMQQIADDITRVGPSAWRQHFADSPAFFMASEGQLAFPDSAAATRAIEQLAKTITHIELRWGRAIRVDPLGPGLAAVAAPWEEVTIDAAGKRVEDGGYFTGVAERRADRWQLRNAHWSVKAPPF
jgi:hypothetical protein